MEKRLFELLCGNEKITFDSKTSSIYGLSTEDVSKNDLFINSKTTIEPKEFPKSFEYQTLIISCAETCNLKCTYCFANEGTYNSKNKKVMKNSDYNLLLEKLMKKNNPVKSISLFGGEPLLGFKYIRLFVEKLNDNYVQMKWKLPIIGIVTNGTLINQEVIEFFEKFSVVVTISLDGEKAINDLNRLYHNPKKSVYDEIIQALNKMKHGKFHLTAAATIAHDVICQYKQGDYNDYLNHFEIIGFDCVEHFIADESIPLLEDEIEKIRLYAKDKVAVTFERLTKGNLYVPYGVLGVLNSIVKKSYKSECGAGLNQMFYSAEGEFYPCQTYYSKRKSKRNYIHRTEIEQCSQCICVNTCNVYCPGSSLLMEGCESTVIERRCVYQKALTEAIIIHLYKYFQNDDKVTKQIIIRNIREIAQKGINALNI